MGIPDTVISDNGPQLIFANFSRTWGFEHVTTSPHHIRSNCKVESSVKAAKKIIKKERKAGEDQYLVLLNMRNTPTQGMESSSAQILLGRWTKTIIPTTQSLLESRSTVLQLETDMLKGMQHRQAKYYNRSAKDLPNLHKGDTVRIKPFKLGVKSWKKAKVLGSRGERSYEVEDSDGTVYRQNRVHLRKTHEAPPHLLADQTMVTLYHVFGPPRQLNNNNNKVTRNVPTPVPQTTPRRS